MEKDDKIKLKSQPHGIHGEAGIFTTGGSRGLRFSLWAKYHLSPRG